MTATLVPVGLPALERLAELYRYPGSQASVTVKQALEVLGDECPDAIEDLRPLHRHVNDSDLAACEELYVRTFELNPVCALEVGWQLFGEQYARGTFLVRAQQLVREVGLDPGPELADHLPTVLRVAARLSGPSAGALVLRFTLPAVRDMHAKLVAAAPGNPYGGLLAATARVLERHYGGEVESE